MKKVVLAGLAVAVMGFGPTAAAQTWTESGDAGPLVPTAQITEGFGALTTITGIISNTTDVDMFKIFLPGGGTFSATTVQQPGTLFDTQLFLFDEAGFGVYANDDTAGVVGARSTLPADHPLTPTAAGMYYLVIAPANRDPTGAGGLIFPDQPFSGIFGPTGPGGRSSISGYTGSSVEVGTYNVRLTGTLYAPEPGTLPLLATGAFASLGLIWRRRKRSDCNHS